MAESELYPLLQLHRALWQATAGLLENARQEKWTEVMDAVPAQQSILNELMACPDDALLSLPAQIRDQIADCARQTEQANSEVVSRLTAWQGEVATILEELDASRGNVRKIGKHYGV